jgi:hypothetical protein
VAPLFDSVPPSASERLSSTSTVWVIASVPFAAAGAEAGAIVCVAAAVDVCAPFSRLHPVSATIERDSTKNGHIAECFTGTSLLN